MADKQYGHPLFYKLLNEMADLHSRKNHDYAGTSDPLKNLRRSLSINIDPFTGVIIRLQDKWSRLEQFMRSGVMKISDESVEDTLMDNAVYSLLAIILRREMKKTEALEPITISGDSGILSGPRLTGKEDKDESIQIIGPIQPVEDLLVIKALEKSSYPRKQENRIIAEIMEIKKTDAWRSNSQRIIDCFDWGYTPQGYTYWRNIHDTLTEEHCYD